MFEKIRSRLTWTYTSLLAIFLLLFCVASIVGQGFFTYQEQKSDVSNTLGQEMKRINDEILKQEIKGGDDSENRREEEHHDGEERRPAQQQPAGPPESLSKVFFSIYVDRNNQVLGVRGWGEEVRNQVMEERSWKKKLPLLVTHDAEGEDIIFLVAGGNTRDGGLFIIGKDVTDSIHGLFKLLWISGSLSLVFLLLAGGIGHWMAGRAMEPIIRSFRRQREFVADASHELRTPLSVLQASLETVEREEENQLNEFSRQVMVDMKDEVGRMGRLVGDLLTLARADSGTLDIALAPIDLKAEAERLIRAMQPLASNKGISLELEGVETLSLRADIERISQLITILVDNAIKYTPEGGRVVLELASRVTGKEKKAILIVRDTGPGIPPADQERIFDRFYRVDKGRSRQMGGTGLGLSIARWITEAHRGEISVTSTLGQGSSFVVTLPVE